MLFRSLADDHRLVGEVFEVPPLMSAFADRGIHVAIVVNEFGSISGLVTREDAIEEVFGEFFEEFDDEPGPITVIGSEVSVRGDVLLSVLNERFELALPVDRTDTVSGYVWHHLGRLPAEGDTVPLIIRGKLGDSSSRPGSEESQPTLRVDAVDGTLVERVSFSLPADKSGSEPA